jgi:hypothetical protein
MQAACDAKSMPAESAAIQDALNKLLPGIQSGVVETWRNYSGAQGWPFGGSVTGSGAWASTTTVTVSSSAGTYAYAWNSGDKDPCMLRTSPSATSEGVQV